MADVKQRKKSALKVEVGHRFSTPSGEQMVILPAAAYDALVAALLKIEDAEDIGAAKRVMARIESGEAETFPFELVKRMRKENRIKVLREHRGMTQKELAEAADTDAMYVSQLENDRARGGLDVLRKVAAALRVDLDILSPPHQQPIRRYGDRKLNLAGRRGRKS